jgi:hypothetical protein
LNITPEVDSKACQASLQHSSRTTHLTKSALTFLFPKTLSIKPVHINYHN